MRYLELMLSAAENKDLKEFLRLNELFDVLFPPFKFSDYDLFRQSCLISIQYPNLYEQALNDARDRLRCLQ